jgi:hypothetical protein
MTVPPVEKPSTAYGCENGAGKVFTLLRPAGRRALAGKLSGGGQYYAASSAIKTNRAI